MRSLRRLAACAFTVCALSACGRIPHGAGAHPDGWQQQSGAQNAWVDPSDTRQRFSETSAPSAPGTLGDLGAKITVNTLLRNKGARLLKAGAFPSCPGEAGLQTFAVPAHGGTDILRVAYSNWSGRTFIARYQRPRGTPDDPAAVTALTNNACTQGAKPTALPAAG